MLRFSFISLFVYVGYIASIISDILMFPVQLVLFRKHIKEMTEEEWHRYQNIKMGMSVILSIVLIVAIFIVNLKISWIILLISLIIIAIISNILISVIRVTLFRNKNRFEMSNAEWRHFYKIKDKVSKAVFVVVTAVMWIWFYSGWLS